MRVVLFDGLNLIRRIHAGVPLPEDGVGHMDAVADALRRSVLRALTELEPTHAVLVMDDPGNSWRRELYPAYKQNRKPMPPELAEGLDALTAGVAELGPRSLRVEGFEADDVIASMAVQLAGRGVPVAVLSTDKSMLTLLDHGVEVRDHFAGVSHRPADVRKRFGVAPGQLPEFLALAGDASQNVPGVRGIGAKTAARLLERFGNLAEMLAQPPDQADRHLRAVLEHAKEVELFLEISRLRTDVSAGVNLSEFRLAS